MRCLLNAVYQCTALFAVATAFLLVETASFAANNNSVTYDITPGAGGTTVVNWTVLGGLNTSGVGFYPANNSGNGFNGFIIDASGIFNGSNFTNNLVPATSTDGSKFSANQPSISLSSTSNVNSFVAIHSGSSDSFGLAMSSAFPGSSDPSYSYVLNFLSGTGSFVLPLSYSLFNTGTYTQTQPSNLDGGPYAGVFTTTVQVAAVPEPSTCIMALAGLACGGYSLVRRRRDR
jgi:hypothetical protein